MVRCSETSLRPDQVHVWRTAAIHHSMHSSELFDWSAHPSSKYQKHNYSSSQTLRMPERKPPKKRRVKDAESPGPNPSTNARQQNLAH
ncbi:hypothetical protein JG687_00010519 [Phytophthora cactorum]|uniref:Uncharacterized protein n=1 Tax=Phytophthora cactorum TaxID=29920 RepID=A0A8T1U736_9STRA|nr:hypothetical protein JG687_00010519 [Phytophthora cactorum]